MGYNTVLVTDEAQLKDFSFCCEDQPATDTGSLSDCYAAWGTWVLERICTTFDLEADAIDTHILMTQLIARVEERARRTVH